MRTYPFVCMAAALLAAGCKKNFPETGLLAATQEGKNSGMFLLNGQPELPKAT